jgi:hypothetical protein
VLFSFWWSARGYRILAQVNSMYTARLTLLIACLACSVSAQSQAGTAKTKISASAVWQVTPQFIATAPGACEQSSRSSADECLINQMTKAGAPADAIKFTRDLYKESHGDFGIMTGFQDEGPVAFGWITYPLRADTNYGLVLVNGQPSIVNVEDLKLLDTKTMKQSFQFQDLKNQFPKVDVWPGDRDGKEWPNSQPGPNGGIQFTVSYPLINGCHACARAGFAIFNWNFDAQGKFLGTAFQGLTPPPL